MLIIYARRVMSIKLMLYNNYTTGKCVYTGGEGIANECGEKEHSVLI